MATETRTEKIERLLNGGGRMKPMSEVRSTTALRKRANQIFDLLANCQAHVTDEAAATVERYWNGAGCEDAAYSWVVGEQTVAEMMKGVHEQFEWWMDTPRCDYGCPHCVIEMGELDWTPEFDDLTDHIKIALAALGAG